MTATQDPAVHVLPTAEETELVRRIREDSGNRHDLRQVITDLGYDPDELAAEMVAERVPGDPRT